MFEFVNPNTYVHVHYYIVLVLTMVLFFSLISKKDINKYNPKMSATLGIIYVIFLTFYIGIRPESYVFVDMLTYVHTFKGIQQGWEFEVISRDALFQSLTAFCAKTMDSTGYFTTIAIIYVLPCYLASRKLFGSYWYIGFLMLVGAFSFWSYGTNGLRNGLATSVFLYALSFKNMIPKILLMLVATQFHKSIFMPFGAYIITLFFNNSQVLLRFWILSIPLSLIAGSAFESIFASVGFADIGDRMQGYTVETVSQEIAYNTGFRWDFLLYSASGIYAGWYYLEKLKFQDKTYKTIFNIYLIANAFWILVIRAPFSNRFAYLSWFLLPVVLIYPLLKKRIVPNQATKIALIMLANFAFSFIMTVILGK